MRSYAIRRILGAIPTLFVIVTLAFFMMRLAPGGPFEAGRHLPPQIEANIRAAYQLDKPLVQQYALYLGRLMRFDLGPSYTMRDFTVGELIALGLPVSARLGLAAITVALAFGVALGTAAALKQNGPGDTGVMALAMIGIAIPTFVTAPLLTLMFGVHGVHLLGQDLRLPVGGWNGGDLRHMILPVIVLALPQIAVIARLVRASTIEVLHANFVRTARAKGLPQRAILVRHVLPASLLPLVSYLGPAVAGLITGSLVVEQIFGIPGIGRYFVQAALNRDYTLMMGVIIVYAVFVIVLNLVADLIYAMLDPRVSYRR
jgi:oligopeptide transport system permease protein